MYTENKCNFCGSKNLIECKCRRADTPYIAQHLATSPRPNINMSSSPCISEQCYYELSTVTAMAGTIHMHSVVDQKSE